MREQQCCVCEHSDAHLFEWDTPGQQLDQISGSHDGVGVKCFLSGANCDASLDQVQRGFDVLRRTIIHVAHDVVLLRSADMPISPNCYPSVNLLPLLRLSPQAASTLSGRLLCIWGRGWRSCSPPADHGGCRLW